MDTFMIYCHTRVYVSRSDGFHQTVRLEKFEWPCCYVRFDKVLLISVGFGTAVECFLQLYNAFFLSHTLSLCVSLIIWSWCSHNGRYWCLNIFRTSSEKCGARDEWITWEIQTTFYKKTWKEAVSSKLVLKWMLIKWCVRIWSGLIRTRIGSGGGFMWTQ
jgi:hypothetical protein